MRPKTDFPLKREVLGHLLVRTQEFLCPKRMFQSEHDISRSYTKNDQRIFTRQFSRNFFCETDF